MWPPSARRWTARPPRCRTCRPPPPFPRAGGTGTLVGVPAPAGWDILDPTIAACAAQHRPDLANRLGQKRARLLEPTLRVPVVGEPNQGKSQLVNALVNAPICAVGDHLSTPSPIVIGHASSPKATLVR